jgi:hypothetical protein
MKTGQRDESQLISELARVESIVRDARRTGFSERTVRRRLEDVEFNEMVRQTRLEMVERAASRMAGAMEESVLTLRHLLTAESETVRLGAARSVIEIGTKLRESVEFEDRLNDLERIANEQSKIEDQTRAD